MILTYLDSPMIKVFPLKYLFFWKIYIFFISVIFKGKRGVQIWTKSANFRVRSVRKKIQIFQTFFKQCFCLLKCYLKNKFQQNLTIFGDCMNVDLVRKTLTRVNLATTIAILMKLTTIVYLNKVFYFLKY